MIQETDLGRIELQLNGKSTVLPANSTIESFLIERSLQDRMVVVELNGQIVARSEFASTSFTNGDDVEVVHFVGGG